ncbi:NAD(P)H-binding protein [Nocardioides aestuarii]|uniref:NAD(P)H-binding protein n=1 Tax=Nocardioides aestuarii TaxID=252231 RepID=A0ABW4TL85_9ACTN
MTRTLTTVLVVAGAGSTGRQVVEGLSARGITPRVLTRSPEQAHNRLPGAVEVVTGDVSEHTNTRGRPGWFDAATLPLDSEPASVHEELARWR